MKEVITVTVLHLLALCARLTLQCPKVDTSPGNHSSPGEDGRVALNIIGLFDMTGDYPAGMAYYLAALLAVKHINELPNILTGYRLQINAYDTMCVESRGLEAFYKEVYNPNRTSIMTLGATCSHVTEATAQVSALWGLNQISYSAISPYLSDKRIFPYFFRVMTPEQNLTVGRVKLFEEFSWKKAHIIYQNFKLFSTLDEYMKNELKENGIEVVSNEMFAKSEPREMVKALRGRDARIIIANMYEEKAREIMCEVYHLEGSRAWYKKIVWLLPFFYDRNWMYIGKPIANCTTEQILEVIGNYFSVGPPAYIQNETYTTFLGQSAADFYHKYMEDKLYGLVSQDVPAHFQKLYHEHFDKSGLFCQQRAPEAYDAVWVIALALNNTLTTLRSTNSNQCLEDFRYRDKDFSDLLRAGMTQVSFNAISGPFVFNSERERTTGIDIMQYSSKYGDGDGSNITVVGGCVHLSQTEGWNCSIDKGKVYWANGHIPVDGVQTQARTLNIDQRVVVTLSALACLGIILSLALLVFNTIQRNHRIIKMSSPRLNNIILFGCILGYGTILLMDVQWEDTGVTCVLRTFTVVLSFSLTFGAFFAKTWRVYEIFTAGARVLNSRMLRDSSLFLIIAILVLVNCLTLVGWMVSSPQKPTLVNISTTPASDDSDDNNVNYNNVFQRCDSAYRLHFTWALVAIQGMVLLLGTYLAVQTRKVTFPELNDSKWIALCIYNMVVLGPVGVVVVMATEDKPEINYVLEAGILILLTTMTQCLIFVPKIIAYRKHNRQQSPSADNSVKRRHMNEDFGGFTLEPCTLTRNNKYPVKRNITSLSCQTSLEINPYLTCPSHCQCYVIEPTIRPDEVQTHEQLGYPSCTSDRLKYFRRSKSDSDLRDILISSFLWQRTELLQQDTKNHLRLQNQLQSPSNNKEMSEAHAMSLPFSGCKQNGVGEIEHSAEFVLNVEEVKTDLNGLSRFGLRTGCREGSVRVSNAGKLRLLLNRLKSVVKVGDGRELQACNKL